MAPKQREMDSIVQTIFHALDTKSHLKSTLLVLCGDHGMNDAGNHGASSPGETSSALVFISPKFRGLMPKLQAPAAPKNEYEYYSMVEQSDITPTIAALLGLPISKNNLGAFIPHFFSFWPAPKDQIRILIRNAKQVLGIITAAFGIELFDLENTSDPCSLEATEVTTLACEWRELNQRAHPLLGASEMDSAWLSEMLSWLRKAQELMSSMASNYDVPKLVLGQGFAVSSLICSVLCLVRLGTHNTGNTSPFVLLTMAYGAMMFASSYVEEEQHFWYWSSTLWIAYLGTRAIRR